MNKDRTVWIILGIIIVLVAVSLLWRGKGRVRPDLGNGAEKADQIRVSTPQPNDSVASPLSVAGEARGNWFFEATLPLRLLDGNGQKLAETSAQAEGEWMTTDFVPFQATTTFPISATATGTLVIMKNNPSGLPENEDELRIPVKFANFSVVAGADNKTNGQTMTVKVYFGDCNETTAVTRQIPQTSGVGRAALNELLSGPTEAEISAGRTTSIPTGVKLNSLTVVSGVALADFSPELEQDAADSCRVQARRAQIEETLKQFPTVNRVVISVDGRSEGVLP